MATLRAEIAERLAGVRNVIKTVRRVTTAVNKLVRLCRRIANRKRSLPDEKDLIAILDALNQVFTVVDGLMKLPADLQQIFRL